MPISPLEAANRVNERVTVEMPVRAAKNCPHCSHVFLDSEEDHHDPNNLAVAVTELGKARFNAAAIDDLRVRTSAGTGARPASGSGPWAS